MSVPPNTVRFVRVVERSTRLDFNVKCPLVAVEVSEFTQGGTWRPVVRHCWQLMTAMRAAAILQVVFGMNGRPTAMKRGRCARRGDFLPRSAARRSPPSRRAIGSAAGPGRGRAGSGTRLSAGLRPLGVGQRASTPPTCSFAHPGGDGEMSANGRDAACDPRWGRILGHSLGVFIAQRIDLGRGYGPPRVSGTPGKRYRRRKDLAVPGLRQKSRDGAGCSWRRLPPRQAFEGGTKGAGTRLHEAGAGLYASGRVRSLIVEGRAGPAGRMIRSTLSLVGFAHADTGRAASSSTRPALVRCSGRFSDRPDR